MKVKQIFSYCLVTIIFLLVLGCFCVMDVSSNKIITSKKQVLENETMYGDVNLDGKISLLDANCINLYLSNSLDLNDQQKARAELDGDSLITTNDARVIAWYISETNDELKELPVIWGDTNGDGQLTLRDATLIQMYVSDDYSFNSKQLFLADINLDGVISDLDTDDIQEYRIGHVERIPSASVFPTTDTRYGDVDLDGLITTDDVELIQKYIADSSSVSLTEQQLLNADVNMDGSITDVDLTVIKSNAQEKPKSDETSGEDVVNIEDTLMTYPLYFYIISVIIIMCGIGIIVLSSRRDKLEWKSGK